jgi:hypothetical protein
MSNPSDLGLGRSAVVREKRRGEWKNKNTTKKNKQKKKHSKRSAAEISSNKDSSFGSTQTLVRAQLRQRRVFPAEKSCRASPGPAASPVSAIRAKQISQCSTRCAQAPPILGDTGTRLIHGAVCP